MRLPLSLLLLMSCAVISGCIAPAPAPIETPAIAVEPATPVIRYGRYTLVEIRPEQGQQALLEQVVDITLPSDRALTVADALHHALQFSGYRLGDQCPASEELYALPLPAAHFRLGPMQLQDALKILAGPGWTLLYDQSTRRICFARPAP